MVKLFAIFITAFLSHPVHVSMSSLYEGEDGEYRLTIRSYSDDLALDMYRLYDAEGEYIEKDHIFIFKGSDDYYQRYTKDHLKVIIDGKSADIELIEKEILDLETLLHFRIKKNKTDIKVVKVENKILTGLYPDQVNLFIFRIFEREEGVRFTALKTEESFTAND